MATCYSFDEAVNIIERCKRYLGHSIRTKDRQMNTLEGIVQGFLPLPLEPGVEDYEVMLAHYQNFVVLKDEWLKEKQNHGKYCWLPLINVGGVFLSLPAVMAGLHDWDENWKNG